MPILDERKPSKATSGRKKRVFFNAFFGRGRIFVILTKEMAETGSLDENLNVAFRANKGGNSTLRLHRAKQPCL